MTDKERAVVRFLLGGEVVEVDDVSPSKSVLGCLREDARCTGTKEGCAEGDCGACTVVIGELCGDDVRLRTVNACIQFLPTLDGKALFTVEDLRQADGALHPVQQAMVDCHGSQCGFCTPGFVMSLWSSMRRATATGCSKRPTRQRAAPTSSSGNLCRCTGYRPILDAGQRMFELPRRCRSTRAALAETLRAAAARAHVRLRRAQRAGRTDRFLAPRTLDELARAARGASAATLLAGSHRRRPVGQQAAPRPRRHHLRRRRRRAEARSSERDGALVIGAGASLEDAWRRAGRATARSCTEVWLRFASPPIRNAGTMGGNVANGSPIGDSLRRC